MNKIFYPFFILLIILDCAAQDERYYRKIYTNEFQKKNLKIDFKKKALIEVASPFYRQDLNDDGMPESIRTLKRDGVDWIEIYDYKGDLVYEVPLETQGIHSSIYKIRVATINKFTRVLILHFFEGYTKSVNYEGRARLYFLSFEDKNLHTFKLYKGGYYFQEKEIYPEAYWQRNMHVNVIDYNNDGDKEISITYSRIAKIFQYLGKGKWKRY
jgi:hypothetical protein